MIPGQGQSREVSLKLGEERTKHIEKHASSQGRWKARRLKRRDRQAEQGTMEKTAETSAGKFRMWLRMMMITTNHRSLHQGAYNLRGRLLESLRRALRWDLKEEREGVMSCTFIYVVMYLFYRFISPLIL